MYETKFIHRAVKIRRRTLHCGWLLTLECGHELRVLHGKGETVRRPVCPECNQVAADLGRAARFYA